MTCLRELMAASALPRTECQMLWQAVLGVPRSWLIAHDTDRMVPGDISQYRELEARRLAGEPMAYVLGEREFMGHTFLVNPHVLIPRPETELLVETALRHIAPLSQPRILDLGTGSGAIAVSLALARPDARVVATEQSRAALQQAQLNARRLGATVQFLQGDWYHALAPDMAFDAIVANPPYIAADDTHLGRGDLRFEPSQALTDGSDGLTALRAIVSGAAPWLRCKAILFVEHGWDQACAVRHLFQEAGFQGVVSIPDLAGIDRITGGYLATLSVG